MSMPGYGPQAPGPRRNRGLRSPVAVSWISAGLALICVAAAIGLLLLYSGEQQSARRGADTEEQLRQDVSDLNAAADRREKARRAACEFAVQMATYDFTDLDKYRAAMLDVSTGDWRQTFIQNWPSLRSFLTQAQTRSKPGETRCGLTSLAAHHAEVLVFVNQTVASIANETHSTSMSALAQLDEQADGRWLVSEMKVPPA
ncbi:hypothetical protein AB0L82_02275 [Nocardia sp. NPDC052001]|uniref:hypothetical protein n=1 Tax=Nocardia sp. NPDC052001 TaxID=3154853 RepID=UPI003442A338